MISKISAWLNSQHWLTERQIPIINVLLNTPVGDLGKNWVDKGEWKFGKKVFVKTNKDTE